MKLFWAFLFLAFTLIIFAYLVYDMLFLSSGLQYKHGMPFAIALIALGTGIYFLKGRD